MPTVTENVSANLRNCEAALAQNPENPDLHTLVGLLRLTLGDFAGGWPEYEWRWRTGRITYPQLSRPAWDGSSLDGKTLLLAPEQGLGDTIQFVRYAAWLKDRYGCRILAHAQPRLFELLSSSKGVDQWVGDDEKLAPPFDCFATMMQIPSLLRHGPKDFPADIPYLRVNESLAAQWRQRLAGSAEMRIGIAWHGSPALAGNAERSIPGSAFKPLATMPGVRLFSLQKGPGSEQIKDLPQAVDLGRQLDETTGAFVETAAVLSNLDLLITCDTAIAHVAGALGLPVWVALSLLPDWRWGLSGETTVWYPSMRLFRQTEPGQWSTVIAQMRAALGVR